MNYDPIIYGGVGLIIGAISLWLGRRWGKKRQAGQV